jgi:hypothetical protein
VVGSNTLTITVTAEDRTTTKTYTITITRAPLTPPPAPVIRVKEGTGKLTVEWDPAPRATAYEVWYGYNQGYTHLPVQQSGGDISGTSYVIEGLDPDAAPGGSVLGQFHVLVYAKNDADKSPAAEWNGDILGATVTSMESGPLEYDGELQMVPSPRVGHDNIEIYLNFEDDLETAKEATAAGAVVERSTSGNVVTITGLTNGRLYYFWIRRVTESGGEGDWSPSFSATPHISAPTIYLSSGNESIEVRWNPVSSADSYPVTCEVWYYDALVDDSSDPGTHTLAAENLSSGPYTITGLDNGTTYTVYVKAKTQYDEAISSTKTATPFPPPDPPDAPTLTPGIGQIEASWITTDSTIKSWAVYCHTADDPSKAPKYAEVPGTGVTIKGLAHNTTYYVWLRAKNDLATSGFSPSASATTPASGAAAITVGFDGGITVKDGENKDVSGGFVIGASGSVTLSADAGFSDVTWYVDGSLVAGNPITLSGSSYSANRNHSVTFTGKKDGNLYSSDPIPFRVE